MKKTKAVFAAMIIVVVAAASAGLWYLNENGKLELEPASQTVSDGIVLQNGADSADKTDTDNNIAENDDVNTGNSAEEEPSSEEKTEFDVSGFLSTFSNVYFAENTGIFDINEYSEYDLVMFAYLHIKNTDKSQLGQEEKDDDIVYYTMVPYEAINSVTEKYFGVTVEEKSIFTENDFEFFRYEDGYFYTPSADGLSYKNYCEAEHTVYSGDVITATFTVYSGSEKYAAGEAKIRKTADGMKLEYYSISF